MTDTRIPIDPTTVRTREGWNRYVEARKDVARHLHAEEECTFVTYDLLMTRDVETGLALPQIKRHIIATSFAASDDQINRVKDRFMAIVRAQALCGAAIAYCAHYEAYARQFENKEEATTRREHRWLRNDPKAVEVLHLTVEHREFGHQSHRAPIDPRGRPRIGPWLATVDAEESGRLVNVLAPTDKLDDRALLASARFFLWTHAKDLEVVTDV